MSTGLETVLYTAKTQVVGGRTGTGKSSDGQLEVTLSSPGAGKPGTNPEQLFAASYAACFHGALALLAERAGVPFGDAAVTVTVSFGRDAVDGLFALQADINIHMPGVDRALAEELVRNTERLCPYAKMAQDGIRSSVVLTP